MDTKKLRQKILDLAIRGKLVPQNPNDEPASVLLERIRAEKQQLIKEGKIKAPKGSKACDTSHYEKIEGPFEIPESWEWVKISDIADVARGGSPRPIDAYLTNDTDGINWIKIGDAEKGGKYINSTQQKIKPDGLKKSRLVHKGDFLLTNSMSFGRPYILNVDGCIHDGWLVISPIGNGITKDYFYHLLSSGFAYEQFSEQASGAVVSNLNKDKVADSLFPLPPINEQHKIVESIENWIRFVDDIENSSENLGQHIEHFKSKVLSLAISGKIVPQDTSEEPAIELLKRINPDFKPCDNSHYGDLPIGWSICTLYDICDTINGLWKGKNPPFVNVGVIRNANFTKDFNLDYSKIEYIDVEQRAFEKRNLEDGDLIVEKSGGSDNFPVGRSILYQGESSKYSFSNFTMALRIKDKNLICSKYLYFVILHKYLSGEMTQMQTQTTGLHNLLSDKYMSMPIPMPPTKEQDRIVDCIEKLLGQANQIKTVL